MASGWANLAGTAGISASRTTINTGFTELTNLHKGASAPTNLVDGMLWFDSSSDVVKVYDSSGATWRTWLPALRGSQGGLAWLSSATYTAAVGYDGVAVATGDNHFPASSQVNAVVQSLVFEATFSNSSHNRFLWAVPAASRYEVVEVYILSDTATTGSDGSNNWSFQVRNLTASEDLCSAAATTNGSEIAADTRYALGVDQNNDKTALASAGEVLELQITKTGTPTDLSGARVLFQLDYKVAIF